MYICIYVYMYTVKPLYSAPGYSGILYIVNDFEPFKKISYLFLTKSIFYSGLLNLNSEQFFHSK